MGFSGITRRQFLTRSLIGGATLLAADGLLREPQHPAVESLEVRLQRLPEAFEGFRIAQISDIHFGPHMGRIGVERAVHAAQSLHPDLLVLTGDFVSHPFGKSNGVEGARFAEPCADVFASWRGMPMIAVLGNHDHWNSANLVAGALTDRGIRVLRNQSQMLERGQDRLWIAGIDDAVENKADLQATLRDVPPTEATILLAHEPDFADEAAKHPVDLQLSGHSHGGQVRIPGIGPLILPRLGRKYHTGLNRVGNLQVYTNRGLGVIDPPVRLNCLPEVTLLTLRRATAAS